METRNRGKSLNTAPRVSEPNNESSEDEDEKVEKDGLEIRRHCSLDEACQVSGKEVFGFKTPKRKGQMTEKANHLSSSQKQKTKTTTWSTSKRRHESPSVSEKMSPTSTDDKTCLRRTPHSVRRRIKNILVEMVMDRSSDEDNHEDGSSECASSSSTSESENNEQTPTRGRRDRPSSAASVKKPRSLSSARQLAKAEDYFAAQDSKSKTSDNTLSRLQIPRLDQQALEEILKSHPQSHQKCCKKMFEAHRRHFSKWIFQMSHGFNLLLYGLGSKITILEEFREYVVSKTDSPVLVVDGFFPAVTTKNILNSITDDILGHADDFTRADENQVNFIAKSLAKSDIRELYVLINNIDGAMLKNEKAQSVLCSLAQVDGVHMVATIDHINAPLLWDQARLSGFNWVWYDATTYLPYVRETSYENSLLVRQSGSLVLTSMSHVFESLTPNAKGIFLLITDYQLAHTEQNNFFGMAFQDCYHMCREAFLVNSELTLRAQLTEFKDHKLIKVKKGVDGGEYLHILLDAMTLQEFKKQQNDS